MKKLLTVVLAAVLALGLVSCGTSGTNTDNEGKKTYKVGICQLAQHPALDAATEGFMAALNELLPGQVTFDSQNASGELVNCATIVNGFVSGNYDLIMANATGALQAAVSATDTIPILGTSVTAYGVALELDDFNGTCGGNVSGTSDLADLDATADMVKEWFPDAKKIGLLFCSSEANSRYQVDEMTKRFTEKGYECKEYSFTDSNDIASVCEKACSEVEVIYIPTDNTAASNSETVANIAIPAKIPVVAGEEGICTNTGVCALSISYYDLGYTTGKMAAKILTGEANVSEMPIEYAEATKKYDADVCKELGIEPLEGYTAIEK